MSIRATISKEFEFCAAHFLPSVPDGHPCKNVHGHTWKVLVEVRGKVKPNGFVMDFRELSEIVKPFVAMLDHSELNLTIPNPTSESICAWFLMNLHDKIPGLKAIEVRESDKSKCRMEMQDIIEEP